MSKDKGSKFICAVAKHLYIKPAIFRSVYVSDGLLEFKYRFSREPIKINSKSGEILKLKKRSPLAWYTVFIVEKKDTKLYIKPFRAGRFEKALKEKGFSVRDR
jgi:hypothetical protein